MAIGKVSRSEALTAPLPKPRAIALPPQPAPAAGTGRLGGDERAVRAQTAPLEASPEVNIQDIQLPGDLADSTTPKATSTSGGTQRPRPRRSEGLANVEVDTRVQPVNAPAMQAEVPRLQDYANGTTPRGSGSGGPQRPRSRETYSESMLDTSVT